jgi:hypothetical protein
LAALPVWEREREVLAVEEEEEAGEKEAMARSRACWKASAVRCDVAWMW